MFFNQYKTILKLDFYDPYYVQLVDGNFFRFKV